MRLEPSSLYDYEARAQQVLPHDYWDFIAGGSKDELTTQRNRSAFDAMSLRPRFLRDVTARQLATTVLGTPIVQHLEPRLVTVPHGWGNGTMYP